MTTILVQLPEGEFGPAMAALNERQRVFVVALVETGSDATAACRAAGYGTGESSDNYLRVQAHRLMHDDRVQAAVTEYARKNINLAATRASKWLNDVWQDKGFDPKERVKVALALMDRGQLHARSEHTVNIKRDLTPEEIAARVRIAAEVLGMDPERAAAGFVTKDMGAVDVVPKDADEAEDLI